MYFMPLSQPFLYIPTKKKIKQSYKSNFTIILCVIFFIINYYSFLITPSIIVYEC